MYRYRLKKKDNNPRRSIKGIVLTKNQWIYFKDPQDFRAFQKVVEEEQVEQNYPDGFVEIIGDSPTPEKTPEKKKETPPPPPPPKPEPEPEVEPEPEEEIPEEDDGDPPVVMNDEEPEDEE